MKLRGIIAMALAAFLLVGCGSKANESKEENGEKKFYDGKKIEMIVPWAAGGGADSAVRLISSYVEKELNCTIVVNNVAGGGGSIGLNKLVGAKPDGLTLGYCANTDTNGDIMLEGVSYHFENFEPVCRFASDPHIIVASNKSGVQDLQGVINLGKDGETPWGIGGAWTHWDFLKLEFENATDTKYKRLVYDGGAAVMTDIMNGDCTLATPFVSEALPAIEAKEAVGIAITGKERNEMCPDIPTVAELGYKDFESTMWRGIMGPAGIEKEKVEELSAAFERVCGNKDFLEAAKKAGITIDFMGNKDFKEFFKKNHDQVKEYYESNKGME